jgi:23S rRNA (adenine2503-C2)-methyltransferase
MGEPLANYKRVVAAVRRITDPSPDGLGISQRSVTVSTVGPAPAIRKLADEKMQVRLAVSLHTPDGELRDTLVPVNERWSVDEVLSAARYYADTSGRRVSIEYALIRDINDQPWRAQLLAKVLRKHLGHLVHVNVIPLNPTPGSKWDAAPKPVEREFVRLVNAGGVACTVRDTRGQEIAAACGQLRGFRPSSVSSTLAISACGVTIHQRSLFNLPRVVVRVTASVESTRVRF